ncbi:hypothetical protein [Streptomyces sp. CT34]|uniref:hypothetical protein n=1 Tax=Streptomyces sp. CT34 TaxID=1553907 RepID=UPI0019D6CAFF|nr:hypothetical protein [Streptomyces sp. CT34]
MQVASGRFAVFAEFAGLVVFAVFARISPRSADRPGCRLPVAGCRLPVAGCRLPVAANSRGFSAIPASGRSPVAAALAADALGDLHR